MAHCKHCHADVLLALDKETNTLIPVEVQVDVYRLHQNLRKGEIVAQPTQEWENYGVRHVCQPRQLDPEGE